MTSIKIPSITFERSFASHPKSKYWSELNELKPEQIYKSSKDKCWFDCHECYHSFDLSLNNLTSKNQWCSYCSNPPKKLCENKDCMFCLEKSFASHTKSKYWSIKNELTSREVFKCSGKKYLFDCDKCNHEFEMRLDEISIRNFWCNYCSNNILCEKEECTNCFEKSFASNPKSQFWSKTNKLTQKQVFKNSNSKYLFDCNKCNHIFEVRLPDIIFGQWCNFCANRKLCDNKNCKECFEKSFASHPKSKFWNETNNLTPVQVFKNSNKKYWFNCEKCNNIFDCSLNNITSNNNWCSYCKNKTELKLFNWLKEQNFNVISQVKFDWCKNKQKLPFDFVIEEYNLIIELDGKQHFEQVSNWQSPEETKIRDDFKNKMALANNYSIIRICQRIVLFDKEDWENQLKQVIKKYDNPKLIKIGNIYN